MNPQVLIVLLLFTGFESAEVKTDRNSLPFLKWMENSANLKKIMPVSEAKLDNKSISRSRDIKTSDGGYSFPSWLRGGKTSSNFKVSPIDIVEINKGTMHNTSKVKINPDFGTQRCSSMAPDDENSFRSDSTDFMSLGSPLSDSERSTFFANTLSEMEVDQLYGDCKKFIAKKKFLFFRFALIKIKPFISNPRIVKLLEESVKHQQLNCIELLFDHFDHLSALPSKVIFMALETGKSRIIDFILKNRTIEDQNLKNGSYMGPYELATMMDQYKSVKTMMNLWSETKLIWLPKALNIAISFESVKTLKSILDDLKLSDGIERLDLVFNKFMLLGFIIKSLDRKNIPLLTSLIKALSRDFLNDNDIYFKIDEIHSNPVIKAISLDFEKGLKYMVHHFGVNIVKQQDNLGYTAFLVASHYLSPKTANYIASVCPDQIHSTDIMGNNALHIASRNTTSNPMEFIESISELGIDWEMKNFEGKTASDFLNDKLLYIRVKDFKSIKQTLS